MRSLFRYIAQPRECGYLPELTARMEYDHALELSKEEYLALMQENWRRFGHSLFRPRCSSCKRCKAIRVRVTEFRPNRSQRRVRAANADVVELRIGEPAVTAQKLELYDRYHAFQSGFKGWPDHGPLDANSFADTFVKQPFGVEEWCYYLEERLIGVGYVDALAVEPRELSGLSAIYFVYDPEERDRSLGIWNVLCLIDEAARRGLRYVYLGYYVEECRSMEYKSGFVPNELRGEEGEWSVFRT